MKVLSGGVVATNAWDRFGTVAAALKMTSVGGPDSGAGLGTVGAALTTTFVGGPDSGAGHPVTSKSVGTAMIAEMDSSILIQAIL
jgi:hypothetical protein